MSERRAVEVFRRQTEPDPAAMERIRQAVLVRRRRRWVPAAVGAGLLAAASALLLLRPAPPLSESLIDTDARALTDDIFADFSGEGTVSGTEDAARVAWERGRVTLSVTPDQGIDLTVQTTTEEVLAGGMNLMNAKGAASILMDIHTGELVSIASLPDFDPNNRPRPLISGDQAESPLFNRAVQGLYELGSTFKIFTVAQGIEERLVSASTWIDTTGPLKWGKHRIRDFRDHGPALTVEDVIVESSNIGTARVAMMVGPDRQRAFLDRLGLFAASPVELIEAPGAKPLLPKRCFPLAPSPTRGTCSVIAF